MRISDWSSDVCSSDLLIVSGCGGTVIYDPEPTLLYRQHEANLIGGNMGFGDRLTRLQNALKGSFIEWNDYNLLIINSLKNQLTEKNRLTLKQFEEARHRNLLKRVFLIKSSGVYSKTVAGNISLLINRTSVVLGKRLSISVVLCSR